MYTGQRGRVRPQRPVRCGSCGADDAVVGCRLCARCVSQLATTSCGPAVLLPLSWLCTVGCGSMQARAVLLNQSIRINPAPRYPLILTFLLPCK